MRGRDCIESLGQGPLILPSLLRCDFARLSQEVEQLAAAGVTALHLDVMDGHFVPNLTYGMPICRSLRELTEMPLDVHLMIEQPERYVQAFAEAGADILTVHAEACESIETVLQQIHDHGMGAGVAINPATDLALLEPALALADLVLVMSVPAGFGGQSFQPVALDKLKTLAARSDGNWILEVDGGIDQQTIGACGAAGADWMVVGSAIFGQNDYQQAIGALQQAADV
jgi:ribulose-phosphate 3-epimerase